MNKAMEEMLVENGWSSKETNEDSYEHKDNIQMGIQELIENSMAAGATKVDVQHGKDFICVKSNV